MTSSFWRQFRDEVITRDMNWVRTVNPNGQTLEGWMRETKYNGRIDTTLLKNIEDGRNGLRFKVDSIKGFVDGSAGSRRWRYQDAFA